VDVRQRLFRQIVVLDYSRILSRLRSRHAATTRKTMGKPGLLTLLDRRVNDPSINPRGERGKAMANEVRSHSKRLSEAFARFEVAPDNHAASSLSQDALMDIITQAYELDTGSLKTVLQISPSIDPSLKTFLPEALSKLGRYYSIACDLIDAARSSKYTLFRRISVKAVKQPELDTAFITDGPGCFDESCGRITALAHKRQCEKYILGPLSAAREKFQSRIHNCTTPWKVHAEVQLLFFYEQSLDIRQPRVLCSSKSACYLCDLFIKTHGKFHVPRTHGRLYDKWIVPDCPTNEMPTNGYILSVMEQLNAILEAKVLLLLSHRGLPYRHPNESVLPLHEPWSSTSTLSRAYSRHTAVKVSTRDFDDIFEEQEEPLSKSHTFANADSSQIASRHSLTITQPLSSKLDARFLERSNEEDRAGSSPRRPIALSRCLIRRDWTYYKLTHPWNTLTVHNDAVNLQASWGNSTTEVVPNTNITHGACWVQVKWLACGPQAALDTEAFGCVDLNALERNQDMIVEDGAALSSKPLCLKTGDHMLFIKYTFEDPGSPRYGVEDYSSTNHSFTETTKEHERERIKPIFDPLA